MKIWYFLQWQWRQFELWQRMWMLGMFFLGAGIGAESGSVHERVFYGIALVILAGGMLKMVIWDGIKNQWNQFNQEQQRVIDIMKEVPKK